MARAMQRVRDLLRSRWGRLFLPVVVCAFTAGLEAGLVLYLGGLSGTAYIAPQASALSPYGAFHDVRWVMVYHESWAGFAGESLAAVLVRSLFSTSLAAMAWPTQVPRLPLRRLFAGNLAFTAVLYVFLSPWAALSVVVASVSVVWYLFGAIVPILVMAPFLQRGPAVPNWWRGLPPPRVVTLSIVNFAVLSAGGATMAAVPPGWRTVAATLVGGANGVLWALAVPAAVLIPSRHWRRAPVTPIVAAAVIGLVFIAGGITSVGMPKAPPNDPPAVGGVEARAIRQPVIFIAGYNSSYDGRSDPTPPIVRYSYRGLFPNGRPRPYTPQDTRQSLVTSAHRLADQVNQVHAATGQKVGLLAVSEGTLVSQYYMETTAETTPHHPVDAVVLLSPVLRAGRVYYPPRDRNTGWGIATGWELRGIFAVLGLRTGLPNSADQPLIRSLLDNAPLFRGKQVLCQVSGVRSIAFLPALDGTAVPPSPETGEEMPTIHILDIHGPLVDRPATRRRLIDFLNANRSQTRHRWYYTVAQYAGAAWQTPALKTSLNPVWRTVAGHSTRGLKANTCI